LTGAWTPLSNPAPEVIATMLLLSDGTVMAHASMEGHFSRNWYRLTPDASGGYVDGTWTQLAPMRDLRVYYPSHVIQDGRVVVLGGEYGTGQNTGEMYDPLVDQWTATPNGPLEDIGDTPSEILPDGRILVSHRTSGRNNIFDPYTNTWTPAGTRVGDQRANEDTWILLPDNSILTIDIFNAPHTEKYLPAEDRWIAAADLPYNIVEAFEVGPAHLLPDGRVFYVGANGRTALYTPPADPHDPGSWAPASPLPDNHGAWDAPGAMMPNGKVLLATGPRNYNGPTAIYEYDPITDSYQQVTSPNFSGPPFEGRMLMLPSGQVLWSNGNTQLYVYTPDGAPDPAWKPTISDISDNGDGTYRLTGTQLNGISEGAAYGDDAEMSSNYPLVQLRDADGNVFYARTFHWSNTGVSTGDASVSTLFTLPGGIGAGSYSLSVVTNGITSDPMDFTIGPAAPTSPRMLRHGASVQRAADWTAIPSGSPTAAAMTPSPLGTAEVNILPAEIGAVLHTTSTTAPLAPPAGLAAATDYFFSKSPSRGDFNTLALSPVRSSSLAASPVTVHLKLNLRPTGVLSAAFFFASSLALEPG
jgi:hypothetical protein